MPCFLASLQSAFPAAGGGTTKVAERGIVGGQNGLAMSQQIL